MNTKTQSNPTETCESIKLGIDAHAKWYYVGRQIDGATPQPVQKMTFEGLLRFVAKQKRLAGEVYTCYEAGPFGYHLHRHLEAMGVTNYVVQPQIWDERGKGVKTDRIDAKVFALLAERVRPEVRALPGRGCTGAICPFGSSPTADRDDGVGEESTEDGADDGEERDPKAHRVAQASYRI